MITNQAIADEVPRELERVAHDATGLEFTDTESSKDLAEAVFDPSDAAGTAASMFAYLMEGNNDPGDRILFTTFVMEFATEIAGYKAVVDTARLLRELFDMAEQEVMAVLKSDGPSPDVLGKALGDTSHPTRRIFTAHFILLHDTIGVMVRDTRARSWRAQVAGALEVFRMYGFE